MATGQTLLDTMELLNQELQLQSGEADVTRALVALNRAQDFYEAQASMEPGIHGSGSNTVVTASQIETTAYPAGLLRIDALQLLDSNTNRPKCTLDPIYESGGQANSNVWPYNLLINPGSGAPTGYFTNGTLIYWSPLPDNVYTVRWLGFQVAADVSAAGTFSYPDVLILPMASFAVRLMRIGVDDSAESIAKLASETFQPVIATLSNFRREKGKPFNYRYRHST